MRPDCGPALAGRLEGRTLAARLEETRHLCQQALTEPAIAAVAALRTPAFDDAALVAFAHAIAAPGRPPAALLGFKRQVEAAGIPGDRFPVERSVLIQGALALIDKVPALPTVDSVRHFWCKEVQFIARPPAEALPKFDALRDSFFAMCKIVTGRRYPAGHHCFELSGVPRRWFAKLPLAQLPRMVRFIAVDSGGFAPFFETHLTSTLYQIPVLLDREFRLSFYRMAKSLEQQPAVRGIVAGSWLHSRETHRINPHLAFMNRPFEEAGGFVVDLGPAAECDGFLAGNSVRAELYRAGKYKPTHACAVCSRDQALAWAAAQDSIAALASKVS